MFREESEMRRYSTREGSSSGASVTRTPPSVKRGGSMRGMRTGPTGVPAHTTSSPYFQTMIDSIGEAGPGLKAPTPKEIYGKHLEEELAETKEWGTVFMKSVDASGQIKNAEYLLRLMDEMVEEIGEENVVQVVTDNEARYFFNPRHQYSDSPHNDGEVLQGTINVISRLSRTTEEKIDAMMEMDRFKLKLDIYRDYDLREAVNRMSPGEWWVMLDYKAEREAVSPPIDVDELLDEEHPLNAWVETRQERDVPEFDPHDCSWAEGELDGVEARDPELRVSEDPPLVSAKANYFYC
ncbi:hypothetical protein Taro_027897 [Colocasia esculenta]|uniref:DUF659 domain-containing protein n=1 Tax=Colocasia esculenta TaxID=4460 RepID=A0A843VH17_COLES|nr:hypothetical protein [Colocasia esculenta]